MRKSDEPDSGLRLDIEQAMVALTPAERVVCEALIEGWNQAQIARELGCHRSTVSKQLNRVAGKFRRWGLDAYLPG